MTISSASFYYIGLFGYLYGATVRNLTMAGSDNINLTTIAMLKTPLTILAAWQGM